MSVKKVTIEEIKAVVEPIARKYGVQRVDSSERISNTTLVLTSAE